MATSRFASALLLASLLPAAWTSDSELLQGALDADGGGTDAACAAGDGGCSSGAALSLLQLRQKPISSGGDEEAGGIADGPEEVDLDGADEAPAAAEDLQRISMAGMHAPYTATQSCYGYTGATCYWNDCNADRKAVCRSRRCVCEGSCAGPDGQCHSGKANAAVAKDFRLTNVKWPKYSMYFQGVSVIGQLKTTNSYKILNLGKDKFSLFKLPGNNSRFFLGSAKYRDKVARVESITVSSFSRHGFFSTDLASKESPEELALSVCYNHAKKGLMFGSSDGKYWAALRSGSWLVYAYSLEKGVGDGGLWTPTPAFDKSQIAMLQSC